MSMNNQGRPTRQSVDDDAGTAQATSSGNRALMLEEALIFEISDSTRTGVDLMEAPKVASRLGGLERKRSACPACPSRKPCGITPASAARTMPSILACFRWDRAR